MVEDLGRAALDRLRELLDVETVHEHPNKSLSWTLQGAVQRAWSLPAPVDRGYPMWRIHVRTRAIEVHRGNLAWVPEVLALVARIQVVEAHRLSQSKGFGWLGLKPAVESDIADPSLLTSWTSTGQSPAWPDAEIAECVDVLVRGRPASSKSKPRQRTRSSARGCRPCSTSRARAVRFARSWPYGRARRAGHR